MNHILSPTFIIHQRSMFIMSTSEGEQGGETSIKASTNTRHVHFRQARTLTYPIYQRRVFIMMRVCGKGVDGHTVGNEGGCRRLLLLVDATDAGKAAETDTDKDVDSTAVVNRLWSLTRHLLYIPTYLPTDRPTDLPNPPRPLLLWYNAICYAMATTRRGEASEARMIYVSLMSLCRSVCDHSAQLLWLL